MADSDDAIDKKQRNDWLVANVGTSYTQAFDIRQVMYRIQNMDLPFRRGIRVEQFLMFFAMVAVMFILWFVVLSPLFGWIGIALPWTFILVFFLAPPILMTVRIGKPLPHGKSIFGTATSWIRYRLDDEWHRRGMPQRYKPNLRAQGNYLRTWTVDPQFAGVEEVNDLPATEFVEYSRMELPDDRQIIYTPEQLAAEETRRASKKIMESEESYMERVYGAHIRESDQSELTEEDFLYQEGMKSDQSDQIDQARLDAILKG